MSSTTEKTTTTKQTPLDGLLAEVKAERESQTERWGVQTHASYRSETNRAQYEYLAGYYKQVWDAQAAEGTPNWDVILLEEVYEALSETDPELRKAELIQVAAVALAEIEAIDLRAGILTDREAIGDVE